MKSLEDIRKGDGSFSAQESKKPNFADVPDVSLGAPAGMYQYLVVKGSAVAYFIAPWFVLFAATLVYGVFTSASSPLNIGQLVFLALMAFALGLYIIFAAVGIHVYAKRASNRFRILFSGNRVTVHEGAWHSENRTFAVTDVTDMRHHSGFLKRICSSSVIGVVSESRTGATTELMRLVAFFPTTQRRRGFTPKCIADGRGHR
ncbi:MAG: hypothetical protein U5N86_13910 [Planctomycetota bacterium]|nr:hypothetical protein [Planctomycetota bacterium]